MPTLDWAGRPFCGAGSANYKSRVAFPGSVGFGATFNNTQPTQGTTGVSYGQSPYWGAASLTGELISPQSWNAATWQITGSAYGHAMSFDVQYISGTGANVTVNLPTGAAPQNAGSQVFPAVPSDVGHIVAWRVQYTFDVPGNSNGGFQAGPLVATPAVVGPNGGVDQPCPPFSMTPSVVSVPMTDDFDYTIQLGPVAPNTAPFTLVCTPPAGLTFTAWTITTTGGWVASTLTGSGAIAVPITSTPSGGGLAVAIDATSTVQGIFTAQVTAGPDIGSVASAPVTVTPPQPRYNTSTKTVAPVQGAPGTAVTYTLVVTNSGIVAGNPAITDPVNLLDGVQWKVTATSGGAVASPTIGANAVNIVGSMPPSSSITVTITGTVKPGTTPGLKVNTANAGGRNIVDPGFMVLAPLYVTKSAKCDVAAGGVVEWTLAVTNPNTIPVTFDVADPIPAWVTSRVMSKTDSSILGAVIPLAAPQTGWTGDTGVIVPAGGWVRWTVQDLASVGAVGRLTNGVTVTQPNVPNVLVTGCVTVNAVLPEPSTPVVPCFCEPFNLSVACVVHTAPLPWSEAVLYVRISSGTADMRNLRIRFWENPDNHLCPTANAAEWAYWECRTPFVIVEIPYLQANSVLTLDGRLEQITVTCGGQLLDGGPWVYGADTSRFEFPLFACGSVVAAVYFDADESAANAEVAVDFVDRSML